MSGKLMLERDEGTVTSQDNIEKETSSSSTLSHSYNVLIASNLSKGSSSPQMQERSVSTSDMNVAGRCASRQEHGSSLSPSKDAPGPQAFDQVKKSYSPPHPQAYTTRTDLNRKNLMILIQIMLKYLDNNDRRLCVEVKKAVAECTKKNREGHPEYRFLVDAITRRLRLVVGDWHWSQLENLMEHYRKKHANTGMSRPSDSVHKFVAV